MSEGTLQFSAPKVRVTAEAEQVYHMISEDQLNLIQQHSGSTMFDISLLFIGAALGLIKDTISVAVRIYDERPVEGADFVAAALGILCIASGASLYFASKQNKKHSKAVFDAIRQRGLPKSAP